MLFALTLAYAAGSELVMQPAGKWQVDYEADMCVVEREFGTPPNAATFALKPADVVNSNASTLFILSDYRTDAGILQGKATIKLEPSGLTRTVDFRSWSVERIKKRAYEFQLDESLTEALRQSTGVDVKSVGPELSFATGSMSAVGKALDTCNQNLFKSWGIDTNLMAEPATSPSKWYSFRDYPAAAKRRGAQGRAVIVATVGPDGRPTACRVVVSSKDDDLDKTTCSAAMADSRFTADPNKPARFAVFGVDWRLEDR